MGTIYFVEMRLAEQHLQFCRWIERYHEQGLRAQIAVESTLTAQHLDQLLWTFSQASFIPHRILGSFDGGEVREPVIITVGEIFVPGFPVLLCEAPVSLELMGRYEIAIHAVALEDEERRQESRRMWQAGKERGLVLSHIPYAKQMQPPGLSSGA